MSIQTILNDEHIGKTLLAWVIDPWGYTDLRGQQLPNPMGLHALRDRHGFKLVLKVLGNTHLDALAMRQDALGMLREMTESPPGSLSPATVAIKDTYGISFKMKHRLAKALGKISRIVPESVMLEVLLDSIAYGFHMSDLTMKLAYRDHFVHPVAVCALGIHMLMDDRIEGDTTLVAMREVLWHRPAGRSLLQYCTPGGVSALEDVLELHSLTDNEKEIRKDAFVMLSWVIAASYHDIGRHLLTLAQMQASNVWIVDKVDQVRQPVFWSYVSRSCFSSRELPIKYCECHYPPAEAIDTFEAFIREVAEPELSDLIVFRLREGIGKGLNELKAINADAKGLPNCDHAFLSALELYTWSHLVEKQLGSLNAIERKKQVSLVAALRLACAAVVSHHLGDDAPSNHMPDTREMLYGVTFDSNPLAVLLRIVDFFQSGNRPFLGRVRPPDPEDVYNERDLPGYKREYILNDVITTASMDVVPRCNLHLPFELRIDSRLRRALRWSMRFVKPEPTIDRQNEFINERVREFIYQKETLESWIPKIELGTKLVVVGHDDP